MHIIFGNMTILSEIVMTISEHMSIMESWFRKLKYSVRYVQCVCNLYLPLVVVC